MVSSKKEIYDACEAFCFNNAAMERVRQDMLPGEELTGISGIFKVMGDRSRAAILFALSKEELCVCDLSVVLNMSVSSVSHHLRKLRDARLVKYRKEGKNVYYSMNDEHITRLFQQALEHVRHA